MPQEHFLKTYYQHGVLPIKLLPLHTLNIMDYLNATLTLWSTNVNTNVLSKPVVLSFSMPIYHIF